MSNLGFEPAVHAARSAHWCKLGTGSRPVMRDPAQEQRQIPVLSVTDTALTQQDRLKPLYPTIRATDQAERLHLLLQFAGIVSVYEPGKLVKCQCLRRGTYTR